MKSSVLYVAGEFRRIGRALVDGSWSATARPMTVPQALAVMAEGLSFVVDAGVGHVVERGKQMVSDLFDSTARELNFDNTSHGSRRRR